ncbi:hypothetical protein QVD17_37662 [Tagetes erecta]|uniref:Glycosyltransferase n=1 Tax=Tagetes erecta TaxID=13708 RepID=A0AAD8JWF2_TARER|nr:hypothetical protein QVD17_37662 [Tagetes erecta]
MQNITLLFSTMTIHKILIVSYPNQGQINPSLRFAHRLLKLGVAVTFCTSFSVIKRINTKTTHHGLTFATFSDGHDNGHQPTTTQKQFISDFTMNGALAIAEIITTAAAAGQPFHHLVYTTVVPWAAIVAKAHGLKSTLLWCQSVTTLGIYYYYFNGYQDLISSSTKTNKPIDLPGLPSLTTDDLPPFMLSSCTRKDDIALEFMKEHIDEIKLVSRVLVNTFYELEIEPIRAMEKIFMLPVGPLVPPEILNNSLKCDLFENPKEDYIGWLNTKSRSSVVYVSFGSLSTFSMDQLEEIAFGLIESMRPFLWVIRDVNQSAKLSNLETLKKQGMIVGWCSQVEVLNHQATGCFVTHCGWNSTTEALAAGVPTVGFPLWTDQATNAKMIEDVWKSGVKVKRNEGNEMVEGKEIKRCLEIVMEDAKMKKNAEKWRKIARDAVDHGGSSAINLQALLDI